MKFGINNPAFLQMAGSTAKAKEYFYIRSLADANEVSFADTKLGAFADNLKFSLNGGSWSPLSVDDVITLNSGESILFKNQNNTVYNLEMGNGIVKTSKEYEVGGNIIQLFYPGVELPAMAFSKAFENDELIISASDLKLHATVLAESCYSFMFSNCTGLTAAPELPATTLAGYCYNFMFNNCTGLTAAPELPATTLAEYCYHKIFSGCTGLTEAPELPATTLARSCYRYMFSGCTGLTAAPELPATTLVGYCYGHMFYNCTGLTAAPELPATTLVEYCYDSMFNGCTGLTKITCLANSGIEGATGAWLAYVAGFGTFTKAADMVDWPEGISGIPTGWNVQDYVG